VFEVARLKETKFNCLYLLWKYGKLHCLLTFASFAAEEEVFDAKKIQSRLAAIC
jgi:hypothetical protein